LSIHRLLLKKSYVLDSNLISYLKSKDIRARTNLDSVSLQDDFCTYLTKKLYDLEHVATK